MLRSRKNFNIQYLPSHSSNSFSDFIVNPNLLENNVSHAVYPINSPKNTSPLSSLNQTSLYEPLDSSNVTESAKSAELETLQEVPTQNSVINTLFYIMRPDSKKLGIR